MNVLEDYVTKVINNQYAELEEVLKELGFRHCIYGAKKEYLIVFFNFSFCQLRIN